MGGPSPSLIPLTRRLRRVVTSLHPLAKITAVAHVYTVSVFLQQVSKVNLEHIHHYTVYHSCVTIETIQFYQEVYSVCKSIQNCRNGAANYDLMLKMK